MTRNKSDRHRNAVRGGAVIKVKGTDVTVTDSPEGGDPRTNNRPWVDGDGNRYAGNEVEPTVPE